jgi:hypothetical protein
MNAGFRAWQNVTLARTSALAGRLSGSNVTLIAVPLKPTEPNPMESRPMPTSRSAP